MFKNIFSFFIVLIFFGGLLFFGPRTVSAACCGCNLSADIYGNCNVGDGSCSSLCPTATPTLTPTPTPTPTPTASYIYPVALSFPYPKRLDRRHHHTHIAGERLGVLPSFTPPLPRFVNDCRIRQFHKCTVHRDQFPSVEIVHAEQCNTLTHERSEAVIIYFFNQSFHFNPLSVGSCEHFLPLPLAWRRSSDAKSTYLYPPTAAYILA